MPPRKISDLIDRLAFYRDECDLPRLSALTRDVIDTLFDFEVRVAKLEHENAQLLVSHCSHEDHPNNFILTSTGECRACIELADLREDLKVARLSSSAIPHLLRTIGKLEQAAEAREATIGAEISVLRGEWCKENREAGRGGCGICPFCARDLASRLEDAEVQISHLRSQLLSPKT